MGKAFTIVTMVIGSLGLFITLMSVILMVLMRESQTVLTLKKNPGSGPTQTTPSKFYNSVWSVGRFETIRQSESKQISDNYLNPCQFPPKDSKPTTPCNFVEVSTIDEQDALNYPLRYHPHEFGNAVLLPDAAQVLVAPGYNVGLKGVAFGQYDMKDINAKDAGSSSFPAQPAIPFSNAEFVGCVGPKSLAVSPDGLRVYLAYSTIYMDPTDSTAGSYQYGQRASHIFVAKRQPDSVLDLVGPSCSTKPWQIGTDVAITCPFGSRTVGTPSFSFYPNDTTGDGFGSIIIPSRNQANGFRIVAIRADMSAPSTVAGVYIYEEQSDGSQKVVGLITLDTSLFISTNTSFNPASYAMPAEHSQYAGTGNLVTLAQWKMLKRKFANAVALGNDMLLCSLTGQFQPQTSTVVCYQRNSAGRYKFHSFIDPSPDMQGKEAFGSSVVLDPTGRLCLIGSSGLPADEKTSGVGGHVYLYALDSTTNKWVLKDTWGPSTDPPPKRAFGHWVNTDPYFTIVCINENMNNNPAVTPAVKNTSDHSEKNPDDDFPTLMVKSIDKTAAKFVGSESEVVYTYYPYTPPSSGETEAPQTYIVDPLFGCNATLAVRQVTKDKTAGLESYVALTASSPANAVSGLWQAPLTKLT